jgi:hypothetical protein
MGDLVRVSWSHVGADAIVMRTGKSRGRREAIVPLYDALRDVLAAIPRRATTILTSSREMPWTGNGLGSSFNKTKIDAGIADANLHFNDLRGTAATKVLPGQRAGAGDRRDHGLGGGVGRAHHPPVR